MFLLKTEEQTKRDPVLAAICFFCTTELVQNTPPALLSSAWCCVSSTHSHSYKSGLFLPPRPARFPLPQSCSPQPDSILVLLSGLAKNKTSQTADLGALPAATASIAGE